MDDLPRDLLNEVLFKIDLKALAMMCCTNRSLQSHICEPYFESKYFSLIGSGLLHISSFGSYYLGYYHPKVGSRSLRIKDSLKESHIVASCSGLLLLFIDNHLCLVNPLTKKFRFLMSLTSRQKIIGPKNRKQLGLAVSQIDRTTRSFKVVHMSEIKQTDGTKYWFEINDGTSWRCSETTITCKSSNLDHRMKSPVYLDGTLHWLRNDGRIIAFNPETEQARLIQVKFPRGLWKPLLAAGDDRLTLISMKGKVVYVYALENILSAPKWVLVEKILNGVMDKTRLENWYVKAYDGKSLVLKEDIKEEGTKRVVHVYDLGAKKWVVIGSVPGFCDANRDFFHYTPSPSSVVGLDEIVACDDIRISALSSIMALIDGTSSEDVVEEESRELLF